MTRKKTKQAKGPRCEDLLADLRLANRIMESDRLRNADLSDDNSRLRALVRLFLYIAENPDLTADRSLVSEARLALGFPAPSKKGRK